MRIIGIYLAAGKSIRMGVDKRFLPFNQVPLGSVVLKEALRSKLDHIVVVTRKEDSLDWLPSSFFLFPYSSKWSREDCHLASEGQGHSIQCGLKKAMEYKPDAVMILLADQPFVTVGVINTLIDYYQKERNYSFIAAGNDQRPMPPILFSSSSFPYLRQLKGDHGARYVIRGKLFENGKIIDFKQPLLFYDVDTLDDYSLLQGKSKENVKKQKG